MGIAMSCPRDEVTLWTEGRKVVRTVGLLHFQNASSLSAELSIVDGFRESYATSIHDDDNEANKNKTIHSTKC